MFQSLNGQTKLIALISGNMLQLKSVCYFEYATPKEAFDTNICLILYIGVFKEHKTEIGV